MALQSLAVATRPCVFSSGASDWILFTCKRQQSTFRRTRKALKIKPDPSFAPSKTEARDHIVFNPPSSIPNVYHTPSKFLPPDDPRRNFHSFRNAGSPPPATKSQSSVPARSSQPSRLPPIVHEPPDKPYNVTPEQVEEIRTLRKEDPVYWTRVRLAEKFNCSSFFIGLCAKSPIAARRQQVALDAIKAKWGRGRTEAREVAKERKKLWGRD